MPHGSISWGLGTLIGVADTLGGDVWTDDLLPVAGDPTRPSASALVAPSPDPVTPRLPCRRPGTDPGPGVVHEETE